MSRDVIAAEPSSGSGPTTLYQTAPICCLRPSVSSCPKCLASLPSTKWSIWRPDRNFPSTRLHALENTAVRALETAARHRGAPIDQILIEGVVPPRESRIELLQPLQPLGKFHRRSTADLRQQIRSDRGRQPTPVLRIERGIKAMRPLPDIHRVLCVTGR